MFMRFAILSLVALIAPIAQAQPVPYTEGQHYFRIAPAQPTAAAPGKVEVIEVFSYACHACDAAQPEVDRWKKTMPAEAQFGYLPAAFNSGWELMARAYFAASALGILDKTHQASFDANFKNNKPLVTIDDVANLYATFGKSADEIKAALNSFGVNAKLAQAKKQVIGYGVDSTPTLVVQGKWRITGRAAGSYMEMFKIAEFLIRMEAANLAKTASAQQQGPAGVRSGA